MIQINLLPWRESAKKQQQTRFGIIAGAFAALGVVATIAFHVNYAAKIHKQMKRNGILQAAVDQESSELMTVNQQKRELTAIDDQLHFIFNLRAASYRAVRLLNELAIANPDSVTLFKIIRVGNKINVFGKAKSNLQITLFMQSIENSKYFTQPVLTEISGKEGEAGEERAFQLKLEQQG